MSRCKNILIFLVRYQFSNVYPSIKESASHLLLLSIRKRSRKMTMIMVSGNSPSAPSNASQNIAAIAALNSQQCDLIHEALETPLAYVPNPFFSRRAAEEKLFAQPAASDAGPAAPTALLKADQETQLFLRYNFARMKVRGLALRFKNTQDRKTALQLALWQARARDTREHIVSANLGLVLTMARRSRIAQLDPAELVSEGNMALLRAVEKFDVARGFKFSTYACRSIIMAFSRVAAGANRYPTRFPVAFDVSMEHSDEIVQRRKNTALGAAEDLLRIVVENTARLTDVERRVIEARFAINRGEDVPPMTLQEVG